MKGQVMSKMRNEIGGLAQYSSYAKPSLRGGGTLSDVALDFLSDTKENRSGATYTKYEMIYNRYPADYFAKMRLADLSNRRLQTLRDDIVGRCSDLSHSTLNTIFIVLNHIVGRVNEQYATDFTRLKHGRAANARKQRYEVFSEDDQKKLLQELYRNIDTCKLAMICSLYLGLNIGEFTDITWDDIDLAKSTITIQRPKSVRIRKSANVDDESGMMVREVPLTDHMKILLRSYGCPHGYIFAYKTGGKVIGRTIQHHFDAAKDFAGVDDMSLSFKALRFTFIANCRALGVDSDTINALCGYVSLGIASMYSSEVSMEAKSNCIERIEHYYEDLRMH